MRSHIVLRSRYTEDSLAEAVGNGVRQYLMLGAGLDTFPYRQPHWARMLRIFEVDHSASQRSKRERLALAGIEVPSNVELIACDFETTSLSDCLRKSSFDFGKPALLSWLGVTMYLHGCDRYGIPVCKFAPKIERDYLHVCISCFHSEGKAP